MTGRIPSSILATALACTWGFTVALPCVSPAQTAGIPSAITTPDKVDSRLGVLEFKDGAPGKETVARVYDNLDFTHAFEAFINTMEGVSIHAIRKGFQNVGVKDNEVIIFSELMDSKSLFCA